MHRPAPHHLAIRLAPTLTVLATALLAPLSLLATLTSTTTDRMARLRDDEAGVSELVVVALLAGLAALAVVAYMVIVRGKVEDEANNLPTSG